MGSDDYDSTSTRIYKKDQRKLRRLVLEATERLGRKVPLAELIGEAIKAYEKEEKARRERELAQ